MLRFYTSRRSALLGAIFALLLTGCVKSPPLTRSIGIEKMNAVLLQAIPSGSSLAHAQQFMQQESFECISITKGNLVEASHVYRDIDYRYCGRKDSTPIFAAQRWLIALVHQNGRITDVRVSAEMVPDP